MASFSKALDWLGFGGPDRDHAHAGHSREEASHAHSESGDHGHTHGVVDPSLTTSERGIWAIKWSFVIFSQPIALSWASWMARS